MGASSPSAEGRFDAQALEDLYVRLERSLHNVVYRWLWDDAEAADVVQEAFVKLWDKRASVRAETVEPFVYRIALNLASNRRRARKVRRHVQLESAEPTTEVTAATMLETREREAKVRAAVEALPDELRQIVVLTEMSELSYAQVAEVVGIPEGTVGSRRHRALAALRDRLAEVHGE
ncbi:MAG: RNA polymerase sigma factor [Sandaracinaceae bacterium]